MLASASKTESLVAEKTCTQCGQKVQSRFCSNCGQAYPVKRITLHSILHEVFHFFTHIDKGFPYTIKQLALRPGYMQRDYLSGVRSRHQKPFSLFFLTITFVAFAFYWINKWVHQNYQAGETEEINFFQHYMVVTQAVLVPVYSFIFWLFFKGKQLNYAEALVFQLYNFSALFLIVTVVQLLKFIWPSIETRYLELPLIILYCIVSNINFFAGQNRTAVFIKTIIATLLIFAVAATSQDLLAKWLAV